MNTLSRAMTAQLFPNTDSYNALLSHWSGLMNSEHRCELSAAHHLLYLALLGKDWRKAFTPITNRRKLENGALPGWELFVALRTLHSQWTESDLLAPFNGRITPGMLQLIRQRVPLLDSYNFRPEQFKPGSFPFDAYSDGEIKSTSRPATIAGEIE